MQAASLLPACTHLPRYRRGDYLNSGTHASWRRAGHLRQVIVAGARGAPDTEALMDAAAAPFAPDKALICINPADEPTLAFWRGHNPEALAMVEGAGARQTDHVQTGSQSVRVPWKVLLLWWRAQTEE